MVSLTTFVAVLVTLLITLTAVGLYIRHRMHRRLAELRPTMRVSLTLSAADAQEDDDEQQRAGHSQ